LIKMLLNSNIEFGHTAVDAQHRYIIELGKKINNFPLSGLKINSLISLLRKYRRIVKKHFLLEEELLDFLQSEKYLSHKIAHMQSHKDYVNFLNMIMKLTLENQSIKTSKDTASYAFDGFRLHIAQYDNEMFEFLKEENIFNCI